MYEPIAHARNPALPILRVGSLRAALRFPTTFEEDPGLEERIALLADPEDAVRSLRAPALAAKRTTRLKSLEKARTGLERELSALIRKIG